MILTYLMFTHDASPNFRMPIMTFGSRAVAEVKFKEFFGEEQDPSSIVSINVDDLVEEKDGDDESAAFIRYDKAVEPLFDIFNNLGTYHTLDFYLEDKEEGTQNK